MFRNKVCFTIVSLFVLLPTMLVGRGVQEKPLKTPVFEHDRNNSFLIALPRTENEISLDPFEATDVHSLLILDGLYEGLFRPDPKTGAPIPALAVHIELSEDQLVWTFHLDKKGRFSNGEPITAKTIRDSWIQLLSYARETGELAYLASLLDIIIGAKDFRLGKQGVQEVGISITDPYTLQVTLLSPAPYLPAVLSNVAFSAIHTHNWKAIPTEIISSGAFSLIHYDEHTIILEKNFFYREYEHVPSDFIQFSFTTQIEAIVGYLEKSFHWTLHFIPTSYLRSVDDLHISTEYSTGFFYFNSAKKPYHIPEVRKALISLIPWEELLSKSKLPIITRNLIPYQEHAPTLPLYHEELSQLPTSLHIGVYRDPQIIALADEIAEIWSNTFQFPLLLDVVPSSTYIQNPKENPYDLSYITWIGDFLDPLSFLFLFKSDSSMNLSNYEDAYYDSLIQQIIFSQSQESRALYVKRAESYLIEQGVVIPTHHGITINVVDSEIVSGWYENQMNRHPLRALGVTLRTP